MKTQTKPKTTSRVKRIKNLDIAKLYKIAGIREVGREYFLFNEWIPNARGQDTDYILSMAILTADEEWHKDLIQACKDTWEYNNENR